MNQKVWSREMLKESAKKAFKRSYWWCVLAALILMLVGGSGGGGRGDKEEKEGRKPVISISVSDLNVTTEKVKDYAANTVSRGAYAIGKIVWGLAGGVFGILLVGLALAVAVFGILLKVLLLNPLQVGGRKFFMENAAEEKHDVKSFLYAFQCGYYGNVVVSMFMKNLSIFLWSLLLVIPGIVKAYEYRMVPYILAEHPELSYQEVLRMSSNMMDGQKMNAFILDVSFIGWYILSAITGGVVGVFWTNPYVYATDAELYLTLSE